MGKNRRIVIGIVPSFDEGDQFVPHDKIERQFVRREYSSIIAKVGAVPMILNPDMPDSYITSICDGIVISGGADIAPWRYGQKRLPSVQRTEPAKRYVWEEQLIHACDKHRVPILGICYGMQRLNVHYGGSLIQDIPSFMPDNAGHDHAEHSVRFRGEFLGLREKHVHRVNSRHHQAIDRLAEGFEVVAEASDGVIEAIYGHGHFGIQWHPESDSTGAHLYRAFAEHCRGL